MPLISILMSVYNGQECLERAVRRNRLLESSELRKRMGAAGRLRVGEHFSVKRMVREHELLFDSVNARAKA